MVSSIIRGPSLVTSDLPSFTALAGQKKVIVEVWDSLAAVGARFSGTATLVGWWDVDEDWSFSQDIQNGAGDLTFKLARIYGQAGEPEEDGSPFPPTLVNGYVVKVYVIDGDTAEGERALIYVGTIEEVSFDLAAGMVTVGIMSLTRIAQQTMFSSDTLYSGAQSSVAIAKDVVDNHLPGLKWDTNNPSVLSGVTVTDFVATKGSMLSVLQRLAELSGEDWVTFVTPTGLVRFFQQSRTMTGRSGASSSARHTITVGQNAVTAMVIKSTRTRTRRVEVTYATGTLPPVDSPDYDAEDPRTLQVSAPGIDNSTDATALANSLLDRLDRVQLRCTVEVTDNTPDPTRGYDLESLTLGDSLRLLVDRIPGTAGGYNDPNTQDVIIVGIDYRFRSVTLQCDQLLPAPGRYIMTVANRLARIEQRTTDNLLKRDTSTVLTTDSQHLKTAGVIVNGDAGGSSGTVELTDDISTDDFKVWINGNARKVVTAAWP